MIFGRFTQQATPAQVAAELNAIGRQLDAQQERRAGGPTAPLFVSQLRHSAASDTPR